MSRMPRVLLVIGAALLVMQLAALVANADSSFVQCFGPLRYCDRAAGYLTTIALGSVALGLGSVLIGRYVAESDVVVPKSDVTVQAAIGAPGEPAPPLAPDAPAGVRGVLTPTAAGAAAAEAAAARLRERKRAIDLLHTVADFNVSLLKELTGHSRPIEYPYKFLFKTVSDTALGGDPLHGIGSGLLELARSELAESVKQGLAGGLEDAELFGVRAARLLPEAKPALAPVAEVDAQPDFGSVGIGRMRDWRPGSFARGAGGRVGDGGGRREELTSRLSHATRYVGIAHAARAAASELVVLFQPATSVALLNTERGLEIIEPAPLADLVDDLHALLGAAALALPIAAVLPHTYGLALAAFIDLERERLLAGAPPLPRSLGQVTDIADRDDRQLLVAHLRGDLGIDWTGTEPSAALNGLVEAGWLIHDDGWLPAPSVTGIAWRFLMLERVLRVRAGRVGENGALSGLDILCVQGLARDLLLIERDGERVRLSSASGPDLVEGIGRLLVQPEALTDVGPAR